VYKHVDTKISVVSVAQSRFFMSMKCPKFRIWSFEYTILNGIYVTSTCDSWKFLSVIVMLKVSSSASTINVINLTKSAFI